MIDVTKLDDNELIILRKMSFAAEGYWDQKAYEARNAECDPSILDALEEKSEQAYQINAACWGEMDIRGIR